MLVHRHSTKVLLGLVLYITGVILFYRLPLPFRTRFHLQVLDSFELFMSGVFVSFRLYLVKENIERLGWLFLAIFFFYLSFDTLFIADFETATLYPSSMLVGGFLIVCASLAIFWPYAKAISRARIVLDALWLSLAFGFASWFLFVVPFGELPTANVTEQVALLSLPMLFLSVSSIFLSIVLQFNLRKSPGFVFLFLALVTMCLVAGYSFWQETHGQFGYSDNHGYIWTLTYALFVIATQFSFSVGSTMPSRSKENLILPKVIPLLVIGAALIGLLVSPSEWKFFFCFVVGLIIVSEVRLLAVKHELVSLTKVFQNLALEDPLTRVGNRRALLQFLSGVSQNGSIGMLFIDLDHFKSINDTYGHDAGDRLLQKVAALLQQAVRDGDFLARLGGDEFVLVFPEIDERKIRAIASRIQDQMSKMPVDEIFDGSICLTMGIYISEDYVDLDEIIDRADQAMLHAKNESKGSIGVWTPSGYKILEASM